MDQTKKANTSTSPEMKISCNVKKGTSLVKNTSQTVSRNHKLDGWDKKANTNTSPEMKISCHI